MPRTAASPPAADAPAGRRAPASARSEQRVRDILREARALFAERGYERATTTELAQRLGVSEATVFTYFRGKRELCLRVISDWYDEIVAAMESGMPVAEPARAQLRFFVRTHLHLFLVQGTGLCALVLSEGRAKGQDLGESLQPLQRRYTAPLMDLLARGQAAGEIRRDLPLRLLRPLRPMICRPGAESQPNGNSATNQAYSSRKRHTTSESARACSLMAAAAAALCSTSAAFCCVASSMACTACVVCSTSCASPRALSAMRASSSLICPACSTIASTASPAWLTTAVPDSMRETLSETS